MNMSVIGTNKIQKLSRHYELLINCCYMKFIHVDMMININHFKYDLCDRVIPADKEQQAVHTGRSDPSSSSSYRQVPADR